MQTFQPIPPLSCPQLKKNKNGMPENGFRSTSEPLIERHAIVLPLITAIRLQFYPFFFPEAIHMGRSGCIRFRWVHLVETRKF